MDNTIYLTGSRMNGLVDNLQVISTNLANANTAGFKGTVGKFRAVWTSVVPQGIGSAQAAAMSPEWPELGGLRVDFSQGPIRRTDRPLDLAIRGKAFFVVDTPAGPRYTRKGRLYANSRGEITDGAGNPYQSDSGVLRLPEGARDISVSPSGQVTADGRAVGRLTLMDIPQPDALVAEGWTNFRNDGAPGVAAVGSEIIQGAIEESNVNPVHEMVALVTVLRAYEASAHIVKRADSLNDELIKAA